MFIQWLWTLCLVLVVYHHVVYPLILRVLSKRYKGSSVLSEGSAPRTWPEISVVVPCYNEAEVIVNKLHNLSFLDYPSDKWKVILVDDGSTDNTVELIRSTLNNEVFAHLTIELLIQEKNQGKVAALNRAMSTIEKGLVLLSDTSALISIDALKRAATTLQNPEIGVVCATYRFLENGTEGEQRYWQYQTQMKQLESQMGSTLGAHGALYAFRANAYEALPADTINDDFILPMSIVRNGQRCVYDIDMVAVELESANMNQDFSRRQRIAAGNVQQAIRLMDLLKPKHGWVAWNFASGKWLRTFMPFILALLWVTSLWNPTSSLLVTSAFIAQTCVYGLVTLRAFLPNLPWPRAVNVVFYLVSAYVASGIGAIHYLVNPEHFAAWQRADDKKKMGAYISRGTMISKRVFDISIAGLALILTLPVWPVIALLIKLESKGPVLFRQMRIGRALPEYTALFEMMKFRTMSADAESKTGAVWATENDPRITRVGLFLRKTRLDELPQLLNVIKGDMSLVGPRPERPGIGRDLDRAIPFYAERTYYVTPGITGLAQVNQGYDTCLEDVKTKLLYDHAYALAITHPWSWIRMDLHVAFKTVWVMVAGRGQ